MLILSLLDSIETHHRHRITVTFCLDRIRISSHSAIEAPIGGRDLNKQSLAHLAAWKIIYLERCNCIHILNELQGTKVVKDRRGSISSSEQERCVNAPAINIGSLNRQFRVYQSDPEMPGLR